MEVGLLSDVAAVFGDCRVSEGDGSFAGGYGEGVRDTSSQCSFPVYPETGGRSGISERRVRSA